MPFYSLYRYLSRARGYLPLAAIAFVALLLRLYRIDAESVDFEEYVAMASLDMSSLAGYIAAVRKADCIIAPLPFAAGYCWSRLAGTEPGAIRLFFVFLSLAHLPLLYALGGVVFGPGRAGRFAGLFAAACYALSPVHIFHAQEYRHTAMLTFLALCSVFGMLKGFEGGRWRWWGLNLAANLSLSLTHLLSGPLFWGVQGLFLLVYRYRDRRFLALWFGVSLICAMPWAIWMAGVPEASEVEFVGYAPPTAQMIAWDLFADDIVYINPNFEPPGETWGMLPQEIGQALGVYHVYFERVIYVFSFAAAVWLLAAWLRARIAGKDAANLGWLLVWFAGPLLAIVLLSYIWRPCFSSRYSLYSPLALYLALGGMLAALPARFPARLAVAVLLTAYTLEVSIVQPAPQRTDFRGIMAAIEREGAPDDAILTTGPLWTLMPGLLRFNAAAGNHILDTVEQYESLTGCVEILANARHAAGLPSRPAWAVLPRANAAGSYLRLEGLLHEAGFTFAKTFYRGNRELVLYRIVPGADYFPRPFPFLLQPEALHGVADWLDARRDLPEVRQFVPENLPDFLDGGMNLAMTMTAAGAPESLTETALAYALTVNPWLAVELEELFIVLDECRNSAPVAPELSALAAELLQATGAAPLPRCPEPGTFSPGLSGPGEAGYGPVADFLESCDARGAACFTRRIALRLAGTPPTGDETLALARSFLDIGLYREGRELLTRLRQVHPESSEMVSGLIRDIALSL